MRPLSRVSLWQLMLDVPIEQSSERRSFYLSAWSFVVEPHEKSVRCLPCVGLGSVQSLIPKDCALSAAIADVMADLNAAVSILGKFLHPLTASEFG